MDKVAVLKEKWDQEIAWRSNSTLRFTSMFPTFPQEIAESMDRRFGKLNGEAALRLFVFEFWSQEAFAVNFLLGRLPADVAWRDSERLIWQEIQQAMHNTVVKFWCSLKDKSDPGEGFKSYDLMSFLEPVLKLNERLTLEQRLREATGEQMVRFWVGGEGEICEQVVENQGEERFKLLEPPSGGEVGADWDAIEGALQGLNFRVFQRLRKSKHFVSFESLRDAVWDKPVQLGSVKRAVERLKDALAATSVTVQIDNQRAKLIDLTKDN